MPSNVTRIAFLAIGVAVLAAPAAAADASQQRGGGQRDPRAFTMLNDEGFPLNVDPTVVAAADADLQDGDIVMGIVLNGEARAYPVNYMNGPTNEVVNDTLGGQAIAPSW